MLRHLLNTIQRLVNLAIALETEGDGDDTDGQDAHLLRDAGNDGGCTCTRTTTHTCGDKGHTGAVAKYLLDILQTLLSGSACLFGTVTGTQSFLTQLQMDGNRRIVECLIISVTQYE